MRLLKNILVYQEPNLKTITVQNTEYIVPESYNPTLIIALSFGTTNYIDRLAQAVMAARIYVKKQIPVIAQKEIFIKIPTKEGKLWDIGRLNSKNAFLFSEITTKEVLEHAKAICVANNINITNVVYIAHPAHIYRVLALGKKIDLPGRLFMEKEITWPRGDKQFWVRSPLFWAPRELLTRVHHNLYKWVD